MPLHPNLLNITPIGDYVLHVTLMRPDAANALNTELAQDISIFFKQLDKKFRVIVLTGQGRSFCAGADLKERQGMSERDWEKQHQALRAARDAILHCEIPIIAAVNGAAYGGGMELALACDFIYAAENARFALPEATLGIMPGMGGTQLLPRAIGSRAATEMLLTGRSIDAETALRMGLVNRVVPIVQLLPETLGAAQHIADAAPLATRAIKRVVREAAELSLQEGLIAELAAYRSLLTSADRHEGITAFNEKRKPRFNGE